MLLNGSRTGNTSKSVLWGFVGNIVAAVLPFIVRTLIIYLLGVEYTGLGSLFTSILSVLSFSEMGIGSALLSSMYRPVAENDVSKVNAYLNLYQRCYKAIGAIIFIMGLILMPFLPHLINGSYPSDINIYILYAVYLINTVMSYIMFAYKSSILVATQRNDIISRINMVVLIVTNGIQLLFLFLFRNYYIYAIVMPIMTMINNLLIAIITKKLYPEVLAIGNVAREDIRVIVAKIKGLVLQQIGSIILGSADTIVISAFLGLWWLGIYNNYYYIIAALFGFFSILQISLYPAVGNSLSMETVEKNYQDFNFFHFLYILCDIFCTSCLLSLFQPFIKLWVGERMMLEMPLVVLMVIYFYTYKMSDICSIYRFAAGIFERWKFVPLFAGIVNLTLNICLTPIVGLYGVIISTIFSLVFIYLPFYCYPIVVHCFKDKRYFWRYLRNQLIYMFIASFIVSIVYDITSHIKDDGIVGFVIKTFVTIVLTGVFIVIVIIKSPYKKRISGMLYTIWGEYRHVR